MSRDIWFFSDHHFSHENILRFTDKEGNLTRPGFASADEMDDHMITMWNESIKPGDLVWHLGDITFNKERFTTKILNKLHGKLRITVGNHDDVKFLAGLGRIEKLVESRRFDEFGFIVSHRPIHPEGLWNHRRQTDIVSVHGHTHHNPPSKGLYINVSVERTDYKPIHIEDIAQQAKTVHETWESIE